MRPANSMLLTLLMIISPISARAVVGGQEARPQTAGTSATVGLSDGKNIFCTGTLIDKRLVLTAAHCVTQLGSAIKVVFPAAGDKKIDAQDAIRHPNYNGSDAVVSSGLFGSSIDSIDDVGLIQLKEDAPAEAVPALLTPTTARSGETVKLRAFGYGSVGNGKAIDGKLRFADLQGAVDERYNHKIIYDQTDGRGICYGDSGGPNYFFRKGQTYIAAINTNIASTKSFFGFSSGDVCQQTGAVLEVYPYIAWIKAAQKQLLAGQGGCFLTKNFREQLALTGFSLKKEIRLVSKKTYDTHSSSMSGQVNGKEVRIPIPSIVESYVVSGTTTGGKAATLAIVSSLASCDTRKVGTLKFSPPMAARFDSEEGDAPAGSADAR